MVAVAAVMVMVGPEEERVEGEGDEAGDEDAGAGEGAEAAARLVRVSPARRADPHRLDEGRRLVRHFLRLRREPEDRRGQPDEESRWVEVGWELTRLGVPCLR